MSTDYIKFEDCNTLYHNYCQGCGVLLSSIYYICTENGITKYYCGSCYNTYPKNNIYENNSYNYETETIKLRISELEERVAKLEKLLNENT